MRKPKDEMRAEYTRADFKKLERGKFYKEVAKGTTVVLAELVRSEEGLEGPDDLKRCSSGAVDAAAH